MNPSKTHYQKIRKNPKRIQKDFAWKAGSSWTGKNIGENEEDGSEEQEPVKEIVIEMKESEPEASESKEETKAEDGVEEKPVEEPKPKGVFHRELLTKTNYANWNQVVGKY